MFPLTDWARFYFASWLRCPLDTKILFQFENNNRYILYYIKCDLFQGVSANCPPDLGITAWRAEPGARPLCPSTASTSPTRGPDTGDTRERHVQPGSVQLLIGARVRRAHAAGLPPQHGRSPAQGRGRGDTLDDLSLIPNSFQIMDQINENRQLFLASDQNPPSYIDCLQMLDLIHQSHYVNWFLFVEILPSPFLSLSTRMTLHPPTPH